MTQTQLCRYCGDFYRRNDDDMETLETDEGWGIDIGFRRCHAEIYREAQQPLDEAWDWWYNQQLDEEAHL